MKKEAKFQKVNSKNKNQSNILENDQELKNEKEFLEGNKHKNEKDIKERNKDVLSTEINEQSTEEKKESENVEEEEEKKNKIIEIKPRETYLKDKIDKMQFNNKIISGINKGIDEQLKSVKNDIFSQKVLLKESPKDLDKYINKSYESMNKIDNSGNKNKYKAIKELKIEKDNLNRKLMQIIENENLLENKNNTGLVVEQNLKEKIKKDVTNQKNAIITKLEIINEKIKNILLNEEDPSNKKQENLKNFIDNFERDKEIIEIRAKKYLKEKKERNKRIANDLNNLAEKRKKEIEDKDKKEKEKQEKMVIKLKRQAKEIENKHSKEVGAKTLLYKPYIYGKIEGNIKKYLFMQNYENFIKNEQNLIDKENLNRKIKMKQITNEEIEEFNNKMDKRRDEKKLITEQKTEKILKEWNKRKQTIPTYVSPFSERAYENIINKADKEKEDKKKINELIEKRLDYSNELSLNPPPKNKDLEQKRLNSINNLNPKRFLLEKENREHSNKRKGRIILKKPDPTKPSRFSWKLKILNTSENELSIERTLIRRPKQYKMSMSMERTPHKLPEIKKDYLQVMIKEKQNNENIQKANSSKMLINGDNYAKSSEKRWNKMLNENGNDSLINNISKAKQQIQLLELKAIQNEQLLKVQEPTNNDVELNKKVSNLLIDSIEAKLSLLNQMK